MIAAWDAYWQDTSKRHQIVVAIVNCLANPEATVGEVFYNKLVHLTPLVPREDFVWLLECLQSAEASQQEVWIKLLAKRFNSQDREHVECLLVLIESEQIPALKEAFSSYIAPIKLDSPQAESAKRYYLDLQDLEMSQAGPRKRQRTDTLSEADQTILQHLGDFKVDGNVVSDDVTSPGEQETIFSVQDLTQKTLQHLNELESGDLDAWWVINYWMAVKPDTNELHEYEPNLSSLPIWKNLEPSIQERILDATTKYIQERKSDLENWTIADQESRLALAGCRAFYLLLKQRPDQVFNLSKDTWQLWSPIILDYADSFIDSDKNNRYDLIKLAYKNAPDESIQTILRLLEKQDREANDIRIIDDLENSWDALLLQTILKKLQETIFKPQTIRKLLKVLIQQGSKDAVTFAEELIEHPRIPDESKIVGSILISYADDAGWSVLWPLFQANPSFGRSVIEDAVSSDHVFANVGHTLSETQLGDFFIWLNQQYPFSEDPRHDGMYTLGVRDYVARLKNAVLHYLQERGTPQAVSEVQRIKSTFPELTALNSVLLATQAKTRSQTWTRPRPQDILELAKNHRVRLIRSGEELLNLVYESLNRLENTLQDNETLPVLDLWNQIKPGLLKKIVLTVVKPLYKVFSGLQDRFEKPSEGFFNEEIYLPVDEDDFSAYVKRYLENDIKPLGLIVSREVEINRGDYVDLRIDCVSRVPSAELPSFFSVIIEVKGVWNRELSTSMQSQLRDRYLSDISCQYGIYLIGWFNCEKWSRTDYRKAEAERLTRDFSTVNEAKEHFDAEAARLSEVGKQIRAFVLNASLP